jgi:Tol biopolymer transport system component
VQLEDGDAWGTPVAVPGASSPSLEEDDVTLSSSANELIFAVVQDNGEKDLFSMSRAGAGAAWRIPEPLPFNTADTEETPRLSADDLTLYFGSTRPGGVGSGDIWMVKRDGVGQPWSTPQPVPGVNTVGYEKWFMPCEAHGRYVMVQNPDTGTSTVVVEGELGGPATLLGVLSSAEGETGTFLTPDCLTMYFASTRGQTNDIYRSQRASIDAAWSTPTVVEDFGVAEDESDPWESRSGTTFAFTSNKAGTTDIYLSTR